MKKVAYMVAEAWEEISPNTLHKPWNKIIHCTPKSKSTESSSAPILDQSDFNTNYASGIIAGLSEFAIADSDSPSHTSITLWINPVMLFGTESDLQESHQQYY